MTLEQAVERLARNGMWFEGHVPEDRNEDRFSWFVWDVEDSCRGEGDTWQEAYEEATGEAPF